ncbi:helix-turn-helix transcriptional regulator [Thermoleptolyngbya sichuanensis A183]|uniref:Helix-turn-helix transcriptional regulator n=1 Tax=Thermoleptolyngbya sichuanensis A183 TaxID=2737172 RepID=A0A6M8BK32_9CYAN|nr:helix-turn-helix transcriptional regulator [Thermoleptolyngbya sichuanensis A183]
MDSRSYSSSDFKCPIQFTLDLIGSKWAILILRELFASAPNQNGRPARRTHEFLDALPGLSTKTLMARLRELEEHGLIERTVYAEIPPRVEYRLTDKGREIQPVMAALHQVGMRWLQQGVCECPLDMPHQEAPQPDALPNALPDALTAIAPNTQPHLAACSSSRVESQV